MAKNNKLSIHDAGSQWDLRVGDTIKRTELHAKYGGRRQGGISPSAQSPNVMIFQDPKIGSKYGYKNEWRDGVFHYTGEGQEGDQTLDQGNGAILHHREQSRALRLFEGSGGSVKYVGELEIDPNHPYYRMDAPELRSDRIREVLRFRLLPVDAVPDGSQSKPPTRRERLTLPLEAQHTESALIAPKREPYEAERRENALVKEYEAYLAKAGQELCRERLPIEKEEQDIITDAYNADRKQLLEAKGTVTREAIRMAIGQLADYGRFYPDAAKAVLLPRRPRPDLEKLLRSQGIHVVWRTESGAFDDNAEGEFLV